MCYEKEGECGELRFKRMLGRALGGYDERSFGRERERGITKNVVERTFTKSIFEAFVLLKR
jgi:hypothetical protein